LAKHLDARCLVSEEPTTALLVRELRHRLGLTQEKMAARLGVTFPTINRWENGRAKPSPLALKRIEDLLGDLGEDGRDLRTMYLRKEGI
jgi:putative transcriptional regulator